MMDAGAVDINERILMMKIKYSVLKEKMKRYECG
jgi:hypothetical protein